MIRKVLIVDDEPHVSGLLMAFLQGRGYEVAHAECGKGAIEAARAVCPDIIVLDVDMPDLDGTEVCRRIRRDPILRTVPVLCLSGVTDPQVQERAFKVGASAWVTKPCPFPQLLEHMEGLEATV